MIAIASLRETEALAARLAPKLQAGDVVALQGDLGAGKTTFVRALITALGGEARDVVSPTFTLVQHYETRLPVVHIDAYRVGGDDGFRALGHEELFPVDGHGAPAALTAVEWADLVAGSLPSHSLWLRFIAGEGEARSVEVHSSPEVLARLGLPEQG